MSKDNKTNKQVKKSNVNTKVNKQKRVGRRSKYDTHVLPNIKRIPKWRRDGMTEEQVAKRCGVAYSTFREYIKKYSALEAAIKKGREVLIEELEDSLYNRAMGLELIERRTEKDVSDEYGTRVKTVEIVRQVAPDTAALIFALKNLIPSKWKNQDRVEISTDNETNNLLQGIAQQFNARKKDPALKKVDTLED